MGTNNNITGENNVLNTVRQIGADLHAAGVRLSNEPYRHSLDHLPAHRKQKEITPQEKQQLFALLLSEEPNAALYGFFMLPPDDEELFAGRGLER